MNGDMHVMEEIERIKRKLVSLGPLSPGSLSKYKRSRDGAYYQLTYNHAGKGHTEYVHEENVESALQELENYRKLRELVRNG